MRLSSLAKDISYRRYCCPCHCYLCSRTRHARGQLLPPSLAMFSVISVLEPFVHWAKGTLDGTGADSTDLFAFPCLLVGICSQQWAVIVHKQTVQSTSNWQVWLILPTKTIDGSNIESGSLHRVVPTFFLFVSYNLSLISLSLSHSFVKLIAYLFLSCLFVWLFTFPLWTVNVIISDEGSFLWWFDNCSGSFYSLIVSSSKTSARWHKVLMIVIRHFHLCY